MGTRHLTTILAIGALAMASGRTGADEPKPGRPARAPRSVPEQRPAPAARGEDGGRLPARRSVAHFPGGLHPALEEANRTDERVPVFLLLGRGVGASEGPDPRAVKQDHLPAIREVGRRIREIEARGRSGEGRAAAAPLRLDLSPEGAARRRELQEQADALLHRMRREVADRLRRDGQASRNAVSAEVERLGGDVLYAVVHGNLLRADVPGDVLRQLADHPLVRQIVPVTEGAPQLDVSMPSAGYDQWWVSGLDGGAFDAGIADTGVQQDHPAFSGLRFFSNEPSPTDPDGHGTHVTGIVASGDALLQGGAWGLDAVIWGQAGGFAFATMDYAVTTAAESPEVFNMSWGYGQAIDEDYNFEDEWFDTYIEAFDVLVAFSAANSGWSDTQPTIHHPAAGYNSLSVANMDDGGTFGRSDDRRASSSSVGPTLTGRRKPDIAAPGSAIRSTNAHWAATQNVGQCTGSSNPGATCSSDADCPGGQCRFGCGGQEPGIDFIDCTGTSMASPHVAGAVVLLSESGVFEPMAQKAILINTADWWTSNGTETTIDDGEVAFPPANGDTMWDKSYGWGYLDMAHAFEHRADYFLGSLVPRNDNAVEDDYRLYKGHLASGEKATLVWEKRGFYDPDKFSTWTYALSDLNLRAFDEGTGTDFDSDILSIDSVHQVATRTDRDVVLKVYAWSTAFDGALTESFALATEGAFQEVSFPDQFQGLGTWPREVEPGELFDLEFQVRNDGEVASFSNDFDLRLPPGFVLIGGSDVQSDPAIAAGGTSMIVTWTVQAPAAPQAAVDITVGHSHDSYGEIYGPFDWPMDVTVQWDTTPPSPDPLTWDVEPFELGTSEIQMSATIATDARPVEYFFDSSSPAGGAGHDASGWQPSPTYSDAGLDTNQEYCYRAFARDTSSGANTTGATPLSCDYTAIETPAAIAFGSVTETSIAVSSATPLTGLGRGLSGIQFLNETTGAGSGWSTATSWVSGSLTPNTLYSFNAQARNGDGVATPSSPSAGKYTLAAPPLADVLVPKSPSVITVLFGLNGNSPGTEYLIENLTLGTSSGWFNDANFWDSDGLLCTETYSFRGKARNGDGIETAWVDLGSGTPQPGTDADGDGRFECDGTHPDEDCDDTDPAVFPGAAEVCDGIDNDCDGAVDEGFADADGDGYAVCVDCDDQRANTFPGNPDVCDGFDNDCDGTVDNGFPDGDGDGYADCIDCNALDPAIHPDATEVCDGDDNDCNGLVDEGFPDTDGDGFADCIDCGYRDPTVYPKAPELCDGLDNDCDGLVDDGFADGDGDGFDDCVDCAPADPASFPGAAEICDGADNDCNGTVDDAPDGDGDGFNDCADCAPADPASFPGALEVCDGVDNDCNGTVDDGFPDADGDGYSACVDCDDLAASINPGAPDVCDGLDNDCDGVIDDGDPDGDGVPSCSDVDDDDDGIRDAEDCLPLDAANWWLPSDTTLTLTRSAGATTLEWTEAAIPGTSGPVLYDAVVTPLAADWGDPADCVVGDTQDLSAGHDFPPPVGGVHHYLVVSKNGCGGNSGDASSGPRPLAGCP